MRRVHCGDQLAPFVRASRTHSRGLRSDGLVTLTRLCPIMDAVMQESQKTVNQCDTSRMVCALGLEGEVRLLTYQTGLGRRLKLFRRGGRAFRVDEYEYIS